MMRLILTNLKHFFATLLLLTGLALLLASYFGIDIDYGDDRRAYKVGDEGPHVFAQGPQWLVQHIRGDGEQGFYLQQQLLAPDQPIVSKVYFPLDDQSFPLEVSTRIATPPVVYQDHEPVLAVSDIESSFATLRSFLIRHQVIDQQLNWIFGRGHLVLLGDFVDRDVSTTQVLWFIYQLEQRALAAGGRLHYILGNHEIKNLQGDFQSAAKKYLFVATVLGRSQAALFGEDALLGRWLASKNTVELINGHLFVHGGLHPKLATLDLDLTQINQYIRAQYRQGYYPTPNESAERMLVSTRHGPAWYRGYFDGNLSQAEVEAPLQKFGAKAVVVGHTPQWRVKTLYQQKVLAIGVRHPRDYRGSIPPRSSEGLLIKQGQYFRLTEDGQQQQL